MHAAEMRRCLEECDTAAARRLWAHVSPHLPQPKSDADALVIIHHARTQSEWLALNHRAYSHRWLLDNGYPSGLPDRLKPSAERLYPAIASVVGISVNSKYAPVRLAVRGAMEGAVLEAEADGKLLDTPHVRARMQEARQLARKRLFGRIESSKK